MKLLFYIGFIFLSACGPQPNDEPQKVEYRITPQQKGFLVEINHNATGKVTLLVPDPKAYSDYQLLTGTEKYPIRYYIVPKSSDLRLTETVINLQAGFFQTTGHGFLTCIGKDLDQKKSIQILWNAPVNWKFANSFSAGQNQQNFSTTCRNLGDALYVGGNNLEIKKTWFGALAVAGQFNRLSTFILEEALTRNMKRVLNFWNSEPELYYFVSIRATDSKKHGGTARFQYFQLDLSYKQLNDQELDHLITHEYFHNWNGQKINLESTSNLDHLDVWWFVEGFTDYYAYLLSELPDNPKSFQNIPLRELKRNYETNKTYLEIPYIQGRRIAAKLDSEIRYFGKELKGVMHEIIRRSQENPNFYLTRENILRVICDGNYMSCYEAQAILRNHIDLGVSL